MSLPPKDPRPGSSPDLSDREREIARLLLKGLSNRQIAVSLGIGEDAAQDHMNGIKQKLSNAGSVDRKK